VIVYFDKIITNAQFYDFVMKRNVVVYSDYRTGEQQSINSLADAVKVIE